jgi:hypothetical protein
MCSSTVATSENAVAGTIVDRAGHLLHGELDALSSIASRFAALGCPYQVTRTQRLMDRY